MCLLVCLRLFVEYYITRTTVNKWERIILVGKNFSICMFASGENDMKLHCNAIGCDPKSVLTQVLSLPLFNSEKKMWTEWNVPCAHKTTCRINSVNVRDRHYLTSALLTRATFSLSLVALWTLNTQRLFCVLLFFLAFTSTNSAMFSWITIHSWVAYHLWGRKDERERERGNSTKTNASKMVIFPNVSFGVHIVTGGIWCASK